MEVPLTVLTAMQTAGSRLVLCSQPPVVRPGCARALRRAALAQPARDGASWRRSRGSMSKCVRAVTLQPGMDGSLRVVHSNESGVECFEVRIRAVCESDALPVC